MALTQPTASEVLGFKYLVFYLSLLSTHSKAGGVGGSWYKVYIYITHYLTCGLVFSGMDSDEHSVSAGRWVVLKRESTECSSEQYTSGKT